MALVVALVVAAACPPPGAEARFTKREATHSTRVAWGFWHSLRPHRFDRPGFRCGPQRVRIDWRRDLGDAMATADLWGCRVRSPQIRLERSTIRRLSDVGACGIVTHEFGHLLGYRHVRKPSQLMSGHPRHGAHPPRRATWARAWARCRRGLG
jgi:hypothetical protein